MGYGLMIRGAGNPMWGMRKMNNLLNEVDSCWDDLEKVFGLSRFDGLNENKFIPAIDIVEKSDKIDVKFEVPGMSQEDLSITVDNGVLTVSGEKKSETQEKTDDCYRSEISYGSFSRSIDVSKNVVIDDISAIYKNGILIVSIPKVSEMNEEIKRKIEIKTE